MDSEATLTELLRLKDEIYQEWDASDDNDRENPDPGEPLPEARLTDREIRFAELIDAMNGWLSSGGFLPRKWRR